MTPTQHITHPSRRTVLGAAAWTAPAIVVASAAPAQAASGGGSIVYTGGSTFVFSSDFRPLVFQGASVTASVDVSANALTMLVTFVPKSGTFNNQVFYYGTPPAGWTSSDLPAQNSNSLTFVFGGPVLAGQPVPIADNLALDYFDMAEVFPGQNGSYVLTFSATGLTSDTATYDVENALSAQRQGYTQGSHGR